MQWGKVRAWGVRMPVAAHQRHGSVERTRWFEFWDKRRILRQNVFPTRGESELKSTQVSTKKRVTCGIAISTVVLVVTTVVEINLCACLL